MLGIHMRGSAHLSNVAPYPDRDAFVAKGKPSRLQ